MSRIYFIVGATLLGIIIGWGGNGWRLGQKIAVMEKNAIIAKAEADKKYREQEQKYAQILQDAENEAIKRETKIRTDLSRANGALISLRVDLAAIRRDLPNLAEAACRQRADTLATVFGECTERLVWMAEKADRHASDSKTLTDSWPK